MIKLYILFLKIFIFIILSISFWNFVCFIFWIYFQSESLNFTFQEGILFGFRNDLFLSWIDCLMAKVYLIFKLMDARFSFLKLLIQNVSLVSIFLLICQIGPQDMCVIGTLFRHDHQELLVIGPLNELLEHLLLLYFHLRSYFGYVVDQDVLLQLLCYFWIVLKDPHPIRFPHKVTFQLGSSHVNVVRPLIESDSESSDDMPIRLDAKSFHFVHFKAYSNLPWWKEGNFAKFIELVHKSHPFLVLDRL